METAERLNDLAATGTENSVFDALRDLDVLSLGRLMASPLDRFPHLSKVIPSMPSEDMQRRWVGAAGEQLTPRTVAFVETLEKAYEQYTGKTMQGAEILDFGCGWGRILRLMYRFNTPEHLHGCDPMEESLELCRKHNVSAQIKRSDFLPTAPLYPENFFDLIYAYSVFTHLSPRAIDAALKVLHHSIKPDGVLALTVRPPEFWRFRGSDFDAEHEQHRRTGFAYRPHNRLPVDGDVTYGDTSIAVRYIVENWTDWTVLGCGTSAGEALHLIVYLKPIKR